MTLFGVDAHNALNIPVIMQTTDGVVQFVAPASAGSGTMYWLALSGPGNLDPQNLPNGDSWLTGPYTLEVDVTAAPPGATGALPTDANNVPADATNLDSALYHDSSGTGGSQATVAKEIGPFDANDVDFYRITVNQGQILNAKLDSVNGTASPLDGVVTVYAGSTSAAPSIVTDPATGRTLVVWQGVDPTAGDSEIYAMEWTGSAWRSLGGSMTGGGISNDAGNSTMPSVAVDPSTGDYVVAWQNTDTTTGNTDIFMKEWNGSAWVELSGSGSGGGISGTGTATDPSIGVDSMRGAYVVAWRDVDPTRGDGEIFVRAWDPASLVVDVSGRLRLRDRDQRHGCGLHRACGCGQFRDGGTRLHGRTPRRSAARTKSI